MKTQSVWMKHISRIMALVMLITLYTGYGGTAAFADTITVNPPTNFKVADIGYDDNGSWFADLSWQYGGFPPGSDEEQITASFHEIEYGTGNRITNSMQVTMNGDKREMRVADTYDSETNPHALKPGHIYVANLTASCRVGNSSSRIASQRSNTIKFLTDVEFEAKLVPGTNNIKIIWDDVWDTDGRIDYEILISDISADAIGKISHTERIIGSKIGDADAPPVTVNATEGKLEFTYTGAHPGRRYSVKVIPIPDNDTAVIPSDEIPVASVNTSILLRTSRVGYTYEGDVIWNLSWDPIVLDEDEFKIQRIDYVLYRYSSENDDNPVQYILPNMTSYQLIISKDDDTPYSFSVVAYARSADSSIGDIYFDSSMRVPLKDEIPQYPEAPEIVDSFPEANLSYEDLVTPHSATVMWKVPYNGEGIGDDYIDKDIVYDIYLVDDIRYVKSPPDEYKIASDISMSRANEIRAGKDAKNTDPERQILGYRYDLTGLDSQSIYYFVIRAKKYYLVEERKSGLVVSTPKAFCSDYSVKVIITQPDTGTDRIPEAPSAPPFGVDKESVTTSGATLYLKKQWEAYYDNDSRRWRDISLFDGNQEEYEKKHNKQEIKTISYESGWKVIVYGIKYDYAVELVGSNNIQYSDLSGTLKNLATTLKEVSIPDIPDTQKDKTFKFDVTGLSENTSYIVWVTVANHDGRESNPSDPIIINTKTPEVINPVTPTAPTDIIPIAAANFVDLFWDLIPGMNYEIRCGTEENVETAGIKNVVTYAELSETDYYRQTGLEPDTQYYIWIKTINPETGRESVFSNPVIVKTESYSPPPPPTGFGVSTGPDGVTENSITYVWEALTGYAYILEFADNSSFDKAQTFEVDGDTYKVASLISNRRYYARLYAYDTETGLRSEPTRTIMVITDKSREDYDSEYDLDDVPTGDILVISPKVVDGVWTASVTGINAYRMAEQAMAIHDYAVTIDLSSPPAARVQTIRLEMGAALIDALSEMKKELYIKTPSNDIVIRPQTLQTDEYFKMKRTDSNFTLRLDVTSPATSYALPSKLSLAAPITRIKIGPAATGRSFASLVQPIRVYFPVQNLSNYMAGEIGTYLYADGSGSWQALETKTDYSGGKVSGEMTKPGAIAAATRTVAKAGTVPVNVESSLEDILAVYSLPSLEGKTFRYADPVKESDIVKLLLDLTGTSYDDGNYLTQAVRGGLIKSARDITDGYARRDKAARLLVSYYQFRTRMAVQPQNPSAWSRYPDLNKVSSDALNAVKFSIENGVIQPTGNYLNPDKTITYGELVRMLEKILILCGDL